MVDPAQRRLAALLSLDAAGYSRLMADDDAATVRTISAYRDAIRLLVEQHEGRVVDAAGDNLLAELPSATAAVACAAEIQRVVRARNESLPDERRMQFRIGVHLGDVLVDGERIYGDGVNIAARLEALAPVGGLCISGEVHRQVAARLDLAYEDLGEQTVKNIPHPVRVYRVSLDGAPPSRRRAPLRAAAAALAALAVLGAAALVLTWPAPLGLLLDWSGASGPPVNPALPDRPSLVVLPFANLSDDSGQEYFADGFTDDLTTDLSAIPDLFVISRTSAFSYKGRDVAIADIARALGVQYVVEGSVRRGGDGLRINAQLIDAASGFHVWAERYERPPAEVLALGPEISRAILAALKIELREAEVRRLTRRSTDSLAGYDAWYRGYTSYQRFTKEDNREARRWFARASQLDPEFSDAFALEASTYIIEYSFGWSLERSLLDRAQQLGERALALDPDSPTALSALSEVHLFHGRREEAIRLARRAVEQAPNFDPPYIMLALALAAEGRYLPALQAVQQAQRLNPAAPSAVWTAAAVMNLGMGRRAEGIALFERARESNADLIIPRLALASLYESEGRHADASSLVREALRVNPGLSVDGVGSWLVVGEELLDLERLRGAGLPARAGDRERDGAGRGGGG